MAKKSINARKGTAVFTINDEDMAISLQGLDMVTLYYLALIGAHEVLVKRKDPKKTWKDVLHGNLVKEKEYKPIIHAVSKVYGLSLEDAELAYSELNQQEKMQLREDNRIKAELLQLEPVKTFDFAGVLETKEIQQAEDQP